GVCFGARKQCPEWRFCATLQEQQRQSMTWHLVSTCPAGGASCADFNPALEGGTATSPDQIVILVMRADPEPLDPVLLPYGQSAVVAPDSSGPKSAHLLEVKRWMSGVAKPEFEVFPGEPLDF